MVMTSLPFAIRSIIENEQSNNAGGLPQWPAKFLIPLAFSILFIQGVSELIEHVGLSQPLVSWHLGRLRLAGLVETRRAGRETVTAQFPFQANGKALGLGDYVGWVKLVVDEKYGEILGAHMIGPEVTELLPELTLAHNMELTAEEIARNVHAHPSLSEVLMETAHGLVSEPFHLGRPGRFLRTARVLTVAGVAGAVAGRRSPICCSRKSIRTRSISRPTTTAVCRSRRFCRRVCRCCS